MLSRSDLTAHVLSNFWQSGAVVWKPHGKQASKTVGNQSIKNMKVNLPRGSLIWAGALAIVGIPFFPPPSKDSFVNSVKGPTILN